MNIFKKIFQIASIFYLLISSITSISASNILLNNNSGFESSTSLQYWKEVGTSSSISRSSTYSHSGNYACKFDNPTSSFGARGVLSTNYSSLVITGNSNYRAGAWFYVDNNVGAVNDTKLYLGVVWLNSSYVALSTNAKVFTNMQFNTWKYHFIQVTAPASASYIELLIQGRETVGNDNDIYVDDTEIWSIGQGCTLYLPGDHNHWDGENNWTLDFYNEFTIDRMPPGYCRKVVNPKDEDYFKLVKSSWGDAQNWSAGYWINGYDKVWSIPRNDQGNNNNAKWESPTKDFITVVTKTNPAGTSEKFGFLATSDYPIYIDSVTAITGKVDPNVSQHISLKLSEAKSIEEIIMVRVTTNHWTSSYMIEASLSNSTIYTCSIHGRARNETNIYYALTSTTNTTNDIDYLTLSLENNNGHNYTYQTYNLGNCWHFPMNNEPSGHTMREPITPASGNWAYFYNGNQFQGSGNTADQNGGILYWKRATDSVWNTATFNYNSTSGDNKYWMASVSFDETWTNGEMIQYYMKITYNDRDDTYIYTNNQKTGNHSLASNHPYEFTLDASPRITNLIQPADGNTHYYSRRPKFIWSPAYDKEGDSILNYHIWVSSNANFSDTVVDSDTSSTNPWYQISPILNLNTTYYWRVTAYDGNGWSPYSKTNSFVVNPSFITVDGSTSDWDNMPVSGYGDNTCQISNGIWNWSDTNGDVRTDPPNYGNAELLDFRITADSNVLFFLIKVNGMSDPPLTYVSVCIDTNADDSQTGQTWIAGNSETYVSTNARWEVQFVASLNKTGIYDSTGTYHTAGESWLQPPASPPGIGYLEAGIKWSDLSIALPKKLRFTVSLGVDDNGDMYEISGSDVCDVITAVSGNTWNEVSNSTNNHYFNVFFNDVPYNDTHGGHIGLVYPEHFLIASSRNSTKPGLVFHLTNSAHSFNDGCKACLSEQGTLVKDYNGSIAHTLSPSPSGELLKTKSTGFTNGKLIENVILNQIGNPVNIKIQDSNITSLTTSLNIVSTRPDIHINEINMIPRGTDDNKEWIEIYSKEPEQLNLTNWYFTDEDGGGYHITENITISSNNYLVLYDGTGSDDIDFSDNRGSLYGDWGAAILSPTDDSSSSGDEASFYASFLNLNKNTIIDFVGWDGDGTIALSDYVYATNAGIWTNGKSVLTSDANIDEGNTIALLPSGDDHNSPSDWVSRAYPTPGYPNDLHPVIQEIGNAGTGEYWDYIELFNPLPYNVYIGGWAICDPTSTQLRARAFPSGTIIKSNGFILTTRNADSFYKKFKFYPDFEWYTTGDPGNDNSNIPNLENESYLISIVNNDTVCLIGSNYSSADVSIDEIVFGAGDDGTNQFPETVWRGNNAPALTTDRAIRRIPEGQEGTEDDDNLKTDSDISAENNEDLSSIFQLTNCDPNADKEYYVSWNQGSDARSAFEAHHINTPWKTIQHAHNNMSPGDIALILPGTNYESVNISFSGIQNSNIVYSGYSNNSYVKGSPGFTLGANYITLKNLHIIKSTGHGILVNNNASHNLIQGNTIYSNHWSGIQLTSSYTNYISQNVIFSNDQCGIDFWAPNKKITIISNQLYDNNWYGLLLRNNGGNNECVITNNKIYHNQIDGILIQDSATNNIINNNVITNNVRHGVYLSGGKSIATIIKENQIYKNNSDGIVIDNFSAQNKIIKNTIFSNLFGVYLDNAEKNNFGTNGIYNNVRNGVIVYGTSTNNSFFSNTIFSNGFQNVSGGQGFYLKGPNMKKNEIYNNVIFNNDFGSGYKENIKIEASRNNVYKNVISSITQGVGLVLITTNSYSNQIYQNTFLSNKTSIWIENAKLNNITENTIVNNQLYGIYMLKATNNFIALNYLTSNGGDGIFITTSSYSNSIISNDIIQNTGNGIRVRVNSAKNNIIENRVISNTEQGLYFDGGAFSNIIRENIITGNSKRGLWINDSSQNQIIHNYFSHNAYQGLSIEGGARDTYVSNNIIASNANGDATYGAGILLLRTSKNRIVYNTIYSNHPYGMNLDSIWGSCSSNNILYNFAYNNNDSFGAGIRGNAITNNFIISNNLYNNYDGIYMGNNSRNILIKKNKSHKNIEDGIEINSSSWNQIINNEVCTNNSNNGILFNAGASNNMCGSNISAYNAFGIRMNNSSSITLYRNAVYHNNGHGIWLTDGDNNYIYHNSVASNDQFGNYDNVHIDNNSTGNEIINNIVAYAKLSTGYGINIESGGSATLKYNDVYGNTSGNYNGISAGTGSISNAPQWLSYNLYSTNFLFLRNSSLCIDVGSNLGYSYIGVAPDLGWKEYNRPFVRLSVIKSISNIHSAGGYSGAVPGSTILYKIIYSIRTNLVSASNITIYDKLPENVTYFTDYQGTASGWVSEYSTNVVPNQNYNSTDYTNVRPNKSKIHWVRWKKIQSETDENKTLIIKVIIK